MNRLCLIVEQEQRVGLGINHIDHLSGPLLVEVVAFIDENGTVMAPEQSIAFSGTYRKPPTWFLPTLAVVPELLY